MKHPAPDKAIQEIIARLDLLEKAVFGPGQRSNPKKNGKGPTQKSLSAHILKLRDQGFFKEPKTAHEVQVKLRPVYPCELDRVAMALLRLQRRKQLRKTSKMVGKKKQVAYVW